MFLYLLGNICGLFIWAGTGRHEIAANRTKSRRHPIGIGRPTDGVVGCRLILSIRSSYRGADEVVLNC